MNETLRDAGRIIHADRGQVTNTIESKNKASVASNFN